MHRDLAGIDISRADGAGMAERTSTTVRVLRILSALALAAAGGIHIFLVFAGTGGILGVMFVLNGVAGLALAVGMLVTRGVLLKLVTLAGLLFLIATLLALVLALTVGLFGITSSFEYLLVPETIVIESIGIVILAITSAAVLRSAPEPA